MKHALHLLGLGLMVMLLGAGYAPQGPQQLRSRWARADTDTVRQRIAFVGADSVVGFSDGGRSTQLFIGNVRVTQDSTQLYAGWAKRHVDSRRWLFVSNVVVIDQGDTLRADTVRYRESDKTGEATGAVRLTDGEGIVQASEGKYFIDEKRAEFPHGFALADSAAAVTGHAGTYWTRDARAEVHGEVRYEIGDRRLASDSLTYWRSEKIALARGRVVMEQVENEDSVAVRTLVLGNWARMREQVGASELRGHPLVLRLRSDSSGTDTLAIQADVITTLETDSLRTMNADGRVRYWSKNLAVSADSMVFLEWRARDHPSATDDVSPASVGIIHLFGTPMLWTAGAQVSGDSMRVVVAEREMDSLLVRGNAFVAREDTVLKRIHQMRGHALVAWFGQENQRTFVAGPNAEVIYFQRSEDGAADGAFEISGDEATLILAGDEPQEVRFGEHQGTYYPESVLKMPLQLKGFRWESHRRPVLTRILANPRYEAWVRREADS